MSPIELLSKILDVFREVRDNNEILDFFIKNEFLYHDFEYNYILNHVDFDFSIVGQNHKNINLIEFYLEASDGSPYRTEFIFNEKWFLKSFLFQCQSCFGDDLDECLVCGSLGWGVK